ncbi:hypothetical protein KSP39_PZI000850 [Platanthera zijinensis]|uniref:Uncharacterized protein n=1 Tax=Platanthera zijinensis TaxID=2320716 RepID=A0AAP0C3M1_9ASPA
MVQIWAIPGWRSEQIRAGGGRKAEAKNGTDRATNNTARGSLCRLVVGARREERRRRGAQSRGSGVGRGNDGVGRGTGGASAAWSEERTKRRGGGVGRRAEATAWGAATAAWGEEPEGLQPPGWRSALRGEGRARGKRGDRVGLCLGFFLGMNTSVLKFIF